MTVPRWLDPKITISGAIQIVLLLLAMVGAYYGVIGRLGDHDKDIADLQAQVASITQIATRVTVLETTTQAGRINRDKQIADINTRVEANQNVVEAKLEKVVDAVSLLSNQIAGLTATLKAAEDRRP